MSNLHAPSERELRNFAVDSAQWFRDAPEKQVSLGGIKASLSPSPNDIPTQIEIVVLEPRSPECTGSIVARLKYPNDSEPTKKMRASSATAYIGDQTMRVLGLKAGGIQHVRTLDLKRALGILADCLSDMEKQVDSNDINQIRKALNIQLIKNIFNSVSNESP